MNPIQAFFIQTGERFRELSQGQKVAAMVLLTVTIGSIIAMSFWIKTPDLQLLYANLSEQDASAIVDNLKTQNIPYELSNQGRTIRVPANQVHEVRLKTVFNIGRSRIIGAKHIVKIADECKAINKL